MKNTWRQTFVYQLLLDFNTSNLLFGGSQKIRLPLQRISTVENFEGFYFAISWTELTKVDKSGQRLTDEREGKRAKEVTSFEERDIVE